MDPEVLSEAKDFVQGWIDKAGADGSGVNYEVRNNFSSVVTFAFSSPAKVLRTLWTVSLVHSGTALWAKVSHSKLLDKRNLPCTCTTPVRSPFCFSSAEKTGK